jgi:hypothetical protein
VPDHRDCPLFLRHDPVEVTPLRFLVERDHSLQNRLQAGETFSVTSTVTPKCQTSFLLRLHPEERHRRRQSAFQLTATVFDQHTLHALAGHMGSVCS